MAAMHMRITRVVGLNIGNEHWEDDLPFEVADHESEAYLDLACSASQQ
jgi:hypothetical protein